MRIAAAVQMEVCEEQATAGAVPVVEVHAVALSQVEAAGLRAGEALPEWVRQKVQKQSTEPGSPPRMWRRTQHITLSGVSSVTLPLAPLVCPSKPSTAPCGRARACALVAGVRMHLCGKLVSQCQSPGPLAGARG
jgi:hypothetical protein